MRRGPNLFWGLVVALGAASVAFGTGTERQRRSLQAGEVTPAIR